MVLAKLTSIAWHRVDTSEEIKARKEGLRMGRRRHFFFPQTYKLELTRLLNGQHSATPARLLQLNA